MEEDISEARGSANKRAGRGSNSDPEATGIIDMVIKLRKKVHNVFRNSAGSVYMKPVTGIIGFEINDYNGNGRGWKMGAGSDY